LNRALQSELFGRPKKIVNTWFAKRRGGTLLVVTLTVHLPRLTGAFEQVSRADPTQAATVASGGASSGPIISSDGRYVLFASTANNLVGVSYED